MFFVDIVVARKRFGAGELGAKDRIVGELLQIEPKRCIQREEGLVEWCPRRLLGKTTVGCSSYCSSLTLWCLVLRRLRVRLEVGSRKEVGARLEAKVEPRYSLKMTEARRARERRQGSAGGVLFDLIRGGRE